MYCNCECNVFSASVCQPKIRIMLKKVPVRCIKAIFNAILLTDNL